MHDVPALLALLEEFISETDMLAAHEKLVENWRTAGLIWPDPRLECLVGRKKRRLAGLHARVACALEQRLDSLPLSIPIVTMSQDGRFRLQ
jgi:hypothetical protein